VSEEEGQMFREAERLGEELEQRKQRLKTSIVQRGLRAAKLAARKVS
jgi:hypothetical protein